MTTPKEYEIISFKTTKDWNVWLKENHATAPGIWVKFAKKQSGIASVTPAEALDVALCYGWIDGQRNKFDENYFINKYTPRTSKSVWSKRNQDIVARLIASKKMQPAGFAQIEMAKKDGRWEQAYDSPRNMQPPEDFLIELSKNKKAEAFYKTLNKANTFAISWRIVMAKRPETRQRRINDLVAMLGREEKIH